MKSAMRYLLSSLLALGLLLAATAHGQNKDKDKKDKDPSKEATTEYFPLKEGTTWTYRAGDKEFTITVAGVEKKGDPAVPCFKLETRNSKKEKELIATEYVAVKEDGVYRYGFEKSDAKPPLRFLKLPVKSGEKKWSIDSKVGGKDVKGSFSLGEEKEPVKVLTNTYKDVITVRSEGLEIDGQKVPVRYYFAPKVGMVKQVVEVGGTEVTLELVKVEEKKVEEKK
jgi:hypothetical protein